jgi:hypothetical protein
LFKALAALHAALRELPAFSAAAPPQKYPAIGVHEHNANIRPKAPRVDVIRHGNLLPRRPPQEQGVSHIPDSWLAAAKADRG